MAEPLPTCDLCGREWVREIDHILCEWESVEQGKGSRIFFEVHMKKLMLSSWCVLIGMPVPTLSELRAYERRERPHA